MPWENGLDEVSLVGGQRVLTYTADVAETYPCNSRSCHHCLVKMVYAEDCKTVRVFGEVSGLCECGGWGKTVQILSGCGHKYVCSCILLYSTGMLLRHLLTSKLH